MSVQAALQQRFAALARQLAGSRSGLAQWDLWAAALETAQTAKSVLNEHIPCLNIDIAGWPGLAHETEPPSKTDQALSYCTSSTNVQME